MRSKTKAIFSAVLCSLVLTATAQAASVSGIVSNKTSGKPSSGDLVELIDVQSGMNTVAKATTDSKGHYTLNEPANGPYLIRATHQGAGYFIAAPEGGKSGDIAVYDASPNVSGISVEADVLQMEAQNDQLVVSEHFFVHNASSPKVTKAGGGSTFEFVLPSDATLDMSEATRPTGMPTIAQPKPTGTKGHYTFDVPIEPDQGEKDTIFEIQYHLPYKGKYTMHAQVTMPVDNFAVQLPKSMALKSESGSTFQPVQAQQQIQIYLLRNAQPGAPILFTVSGIGAMPRDQQGPQSGGDQGQQVQGPQPGGGIGVPIADPDPLTKYKWWILGALGVLLAAAAAFLLRKPAANTGAALSTADFSSPVAAPTPRAATPANKREALLNALKEELFSLESERLSGTIPAAEYAEQKAALEIVLKRALHRK